MKELINVAIQCAVRGAHEYMKAHNTKADDVALVACLKAHLKLAMPLALKEAKEAIDCNMGAIAEATFKTSMLQAGIEAAKEASFPIETVA